MNVIKIEISVAAKKYSRQYVREAKPTLASLQHDLDNMLKEISAEIVKDYHD